VEQNGCLGGFQFGFPNKVTFFLQSPECLAHQMHGTECVMKTGMQRAGINNVCEPQLLDPAQPLEIRVINEVVKQVGGYGDKPVNRVVDDFSFIQNPFFGKSTKTRNGAVELFL
jgi:hypothetical protein